jgi:formiminoglutamase
MQSKSKSFSWNPISEANLISKVSLRSGETKTGQRMKTMDNVGDSKIQFVVLGISEDIGPQTNGGFTGSKNGFDSFLSYFVNVQSNAFLNGDSILILGHIESLVEFKNKEQGITLINELDEFVEEVLSPFVSKNYIPIVIGGGHNNAFPIIKTISKWLEKPIQVVNLDSHADFRALEGRHSGNPFSYAYSQNWMDRYAVMGLHQSYNSQYLLDELNSKNFTHTFWDDYVSGAVSFDQDLQRIANDIQNNNFGLELDMDSIAYMPASAYSPSGLSIEQARKYILTMAKSKWVNYLHLPEAAPKSERDFVEVGKALSYLATDFIKARASVD